MPTTTRQERKSWILEAQSLLGGGKSSNVVIKIFVEKHGIPQRTAMRYVEAAWRDWNRQRINKKRDHRLGRALARCDKAAEIAVSGVRRMVVNGAVEEFPEADPRALLAAVDTEARLLGLYAPEQRQVVISTFDVVSAYLVDVMRREIIDPLPPAAELQRRLARGFRAAMEAGARSMKDPKTVEASVVAPTTTPSLLRSSSSVVVGNSLCDAKREPPPPPETNGAPH